MPSAPAGEAARSTSTPSVADPQSGGQPGVQCLRPAPEVIERIASRTRSGTALVTRRAVGAQAEDTEDLYLVSLWIDVSGAPDTTTGLAVWAVSAAAWRGEAGVIMAADAHASRATSWPRAEDAHRPIDQLDRRVGEVNTCHLA